MTALLLSLALTLTTLDTYALTCRLPLTTTYYC